MPVPHVPMQENTAPTQLLRQPLLYQSFRRFSIAISLISYYGGLFVLQYGVCVCTYAVWGNYILHRFLFVSAGTGPAGRGRKSPLPSGAAPARFCAPTAEAVWKERYGRLQKMYLTLFNATEDAINTSDRLSSRLSENVRKLYISGPAQDKELESGGMAAPAAT